MLQNLAFVSSVRARAGGNISHVIIILPLIILIIILIQGSGLKTGTMPLALGSTFIGEMNFGHRGFFSSALGFNEEKT